MCEGVDTCPSTGLEIVNAPCKVGRDFLNISEIQEPVKQEIVDIIGYITRGPSEAFKSFIASGWTSTR